MQPEYEEKEPALPALLTVSSGIVGWAFAAGAWVFHLEKASTRILQVSLVVFVLGLIWCLRVAMYNLGVDSRNEFRKKMICLKKHGEAHEHD